MSYFEWLAKSVEAVIRQGRIGRPVSVRGHFHLSSDHGLILRVLGGALAAADAWLDGPPERVYAVGDVKSGEVTVMAEYPGGQTALVSAGALRDPEPRADLLLIGARGTLRYEDHPAPGEPGAVNDRVMRAIEKSLAERAPSAVER